MAAQCRFPRPFRRPATGSVRCNPFVLERLPRQCMIGPDRRRSRGSRTGRRGRMLKEFRDFAMKGNVVDLAIGVIIGAAFGKIVESLVGDMFMPVLGAVTGGPDFPN